MSDGLDSFGKTARGLARNPLGIIALFIVLVYGIAAIFVGFTSNLEIIERLPLIYFLVLFPMLVLGVFAWLVSRHAGKLYAPGDFENEENYLAAIAAATSLAAAPLKEEDGEGLPDAAAPAAGDGGGPPPPPDLQQIADTVRAVAKTAARTQTAGPKRVLWVDDQPENNTLVRQALEGIGITVDTALSTSEALDILRYRKFNAIISDMGRKEGPREGYVLLEEVRKRGMSVPFFVYAGSNLPEHRREVSERGGQGSTNSPRELFEMVTKALAGRG